MTRLIWIFMFSFFSLFSQVEKTNSFYGNLGIGGGNYLSLDLGLNFVFKNNISLYYGYLGGISSAKQLPRDYEKGYFEFIGPSDFIGAQCYGVGKIIKLGNSEKIHLNLTIGFARTRLSRKINFTPVTTYYEEIDKNGDSFIVEENIKGDYDFEKERISMYGVYINPKFEVYTFRAFGVYVNPLFILNKESSYYGLGVGLMLGKLR